MCIYPDRNNFENNQLLFSQVFSKKICSVTFKHYALENAADFAKCLQVEINKKLFLRFFEESLHRLQFCQN